MPPSSIFQALDLPAGERGRALLELPEDQWFDRKSNRIAPRELADLLIGFANAEGGTLIVGLSGGRIEGIGDRRHHLNGWMQAGMDYTVPAVRVRTDLVPCVNHLGDQDQLLVIQIEPSELIHATTRDEVYLRVGDENRKLSFRQRQELIFDKGQTQFEATVVARAATPDLDDGLLTSYAQALKHPDSTRLLVARGLMSPRGELTVAGYLLFGAAPQSEFPEALVRVVRYRGIERGTGARQQLVFDQRCEGPIPHMLMSARIAIADVQPSRRALGPNGEFRTIALIPEDAWLEGLVNAVVHRSYSLSGDHTRVEVFDDRIEMESPGRFPGLVRLEDPESALRFARNPRIARVCADLNFGQELGEGIRRMFEEMRLAGLSDPLYQQTAGSVRLTLTSTPVDRELESRLARGSRELLRLIRQAGRLGTGDLVDASGFSRPVVISRLRILEAEGLVRWVGKSPRDPRAHWEIT